RCACSLGYTICVIQNHTQIANPTNTALGAHSGQTTFDPRIAKNAFFRLSCGPVVIDLLIRTARNAHAPTTTFFLVNQDHPILFALIYSARWTRSHTGRVKAVLT